MGMFSWETSDTNEAITNNSAPEGALPCKMLAPDGRVWEEPNYEGYGVFGGKDFYDLLGELNGLEAKEGQELRSLAIELCATGTGGINDDDENIIYPKLVTIGCTDRYEDLANSKSDPNQGFGGQDEDDEDTCDWCGESYDYCTCDEECDECGYHQDDCTCEEEEEDED